MNINVSDKLVYMGAGFGIGAIIGVLFAPQSGLATRQNLSGKVDELTTKVQDKVQRSGDLANQTWQNVAEKGRNVASIGRQRLNESIEAGKRRYNESIEGE